MTTYLFLIGNALEGLRKQVEAAKAELKAQQGIDEIIIRSLRPDDVGITGYWYHNINVTDAWDTVISNQAIADNTYIVLNGVMDSEATPLISAMEITCGGKTKRLYMVQDAPSNANNSLFFDDPMICKQNERLTVKLFNKSSSVTNSTYEFQILGVVVEKKGLVVA